MCDQRLHWQKGVTWLGAKSDTQCVNKQGKPVTRKVQDRGPIWSKHQTEELIKTGKRFETMSQRYASD